MRAEKPPQRPKVGQVYLFSSQQNMTSKSYHDFKRPLSLCLRCENYASLATSIVPFRAFRISVGETVPFRSVPFRILVTTLTPTYLATPPRPCHAPTSLATPPRPWQRPQCLGHAPTALATPKGFDHAPTTLETAPQP